MSRLGFNGSLYDVKINFYDKEPTNMAFQMINPDDKYDEIIVTKNLGPMIGNDTIMPEACAFLDTNNIPGIDKFLEEKGIARPYTRWGEPVIMQSGFCKYPLYEFDKEKLKEFDPKGYKEYADQYWDAFTAVRNKVFGDPEINDEER